jgi:Protein of unknown function (DUF2804)
LRKRWRYVAAFSDEAMLCAARVRVGPFAQTFFALLDRRSGELIERTRTRLPGAAGEVRQPEPPNLLIRSSELSGNLEVGEGVAWEATCNNRDGGEVWTRKQTGVPVRGELRARDGRSWALDALGVIDETDGHHPRHTVWNWSAGVGTSADGRPVGWNLVEGVNDPATGSERAIWIDGEPREAPASRFQGLEAISFEAGERLEFTAEAERRRTENRLVVRYSYRQPFGTFTGTLPGGIELASGIGVMEHHDAHW